MATLLRWLRAFVDACSEPVPEPKPRHRVIVMDYPWGKWWE
jgi:hypothetical protein